MIAQTLAAVPASTHTPSPFPEPTATWTATPEETAPDPLPVQNTGITLQNGECYDLDTGDVPFAVDADCDILSTVNQELLPQNGALLSGYADMNPRTRSGKNRENKPVRIVPIPAAILRISKTSIIIPFLV